MPRRKTTIIGGDDLSTLKENVPSRLSLRPVQASGPSSTPSRYNLRPLANRIMREPENIAGGHVDFKSINREAQYENGQNRELSHVNRRVSGRKINSNASILLGPDDGDGPPKPFVRKVESQGYLHQSENKNRRGKTRIIESSGHKDERTLGGGKKQEPDAKPLFQEGCKQTLSYDSDEIFAEVRLMKERKLSSVVAEASSTEATDGSASSEVSLIPLKRNEIENDDPATNWTPVIDVSTVRKPPAFLLDLFEKRPDSNPDEDTEFGQVIETNGTDKTSSSRTSSLNAASKDVIKRVEDPSIHPVLGDDVTVLIKNQKNWGFLPWNNLPFSSKKNDSYQKLIEVILELQALYDVSEKFYKTAEEEWFLENRVPKANYYKVTSKLEELKLFTDIFEGLDKEMLRFLQEGRITIKINHASLPLDTLWKRAASSATPESPRIIKLTKVYLTKLKAGMTNMKKRYSILAAMACPSELRIVMNYRSTFHPAIKRLLDEEIEQINDLHEHDCDAVPSEEEPQ